MFQMHMIQYEGQNIVSNKIHNKQLFMALTSTNKNYLHVELCKTKYILRPKLLNRLVTIYKMFHHKKIKNNMCLSFDDVKIYSHMVNHELHL
jgi:hypothetical protein